MSNKFHDELSGSDIHIPHTFTYVDEADRISSVPSDFTEFISAEKPGDLFKLARQTSDQTYWVLEQISPSVVWNQLGGASTSDLPFTTATDPALDAAVTTGIIDLNSGTVITLTGVGNSQTLSAPTDTTAGRKFFVLNNDTSSNSLTVNGKGLGAGRFLEFRWDGTGWLFTGGDGVIPNNRVVISNDSEWPTTLVTGTNYYIIAPINFGSTTIPDAGNITIETSDRINCPMTFTGTGTAFTATALAGRITFKNVSLFGNLSTSKLFDLTGSTFSGLQLQRVDIRNWGVVSDLDGLGLGLVVNGCRWDGNLDSIFDVTGATTFVSIHNTSGQNLSDTGSTQFLIGPDVECVGISLTGFAAQATEHLIKYDTGFTGEGKILNVFNVPEGRLFDPAGLGGDSIYIDVSQTSNQADSRTRFSFIFNGNSSTSSVADGSYGPLTLTGVSAGVDTERFSLTNAATLEFTYIGLPTFNGTIRYHFHTNLGGLTEADYRFALNVNGSEPTFDAENGYMPLSLKSVGDLVVLELPVTLTTGQTVRPAIAGDNTDKDLILGHGNGSGSL